MGHRVQKPHPQAAASMKVAVRDDGEPVAPATGTAAQYLAFSPWSGDGAGKASRIIRTIERVRTLHSSGLAVVVPVEGDDLGGGWKPRAFVVNTRHINLRDMPDLTCWNNKVVCTGVVVTGVRSRSEIL